MQEGNLKTLQLTSIYGNGWATDINIDLIDNTYGYVYRIRDDLSNFRGTSPRSVIGGNAFLLIGFSALVNSNLSYGVQLAIGMQSAKVAIRNAAYSGSGAGTWSAWAQV